ncbi:MAG: hypothetical protein WCA31_02490 [Acidimicrobiales bacterium]
MTPYQRKKRRYRDGSVIQGSTAPHLLEPIKGSLNVVDAAVFNERVRRATTFDMGGRMLGRDAARFLKAAGTAIVDGAMTLSRNVVVQKDEKAAAEQVKAITGG